MKRKGLLMLVLIGLLPILTMGNSGGGCEQSADQIQRDKQETIQAEGVRQVGLPNIVNYREMKVKKDIDELRDKAITTYTYLENMQPAVVPGHTALGGKLTYLGETISFPIPYATQITSPMKRVIGPLAMPQSEPNGLFSPQSAEGTWIMMYDPAAKKAMPQYFEPRLTTLTFKLPFD